MNETTRDFYADPAFAVPDLAEHQLDADSQLKRTIIDNVPGGVVFVDTAGAVRVANTVARELLGLDQVISAISGAAPIPAELLSWFRAIGVPLSEVYGMSECTGPATISLPDAYKTGWVGKVLPGAELSTIGSLAYKVALVAAGRFDAYFSWRHSHDWDIAAAMLVLAEAGGMDFMDSNLRRLSMMDPFSEEYAMWSLCLVGDADELKIDPEGRIAISDNIRDHTGIGDEVAFVGCGHFFQLWEPSAFRAYRETARAKVREMRRALMVAFGNARLDHRGTVEVADLPRGASSRSRIGFLQ